jgi:DNA-binding CsgD family transcriptional regulator
MELVKSLKIGWRSLAFVAFFSTLPIYSPNMTFFPLPGFDLSMPWFANAALAAAAVTGIATAILALVRPSFRRIPPVMASVAAIGQTLAIFLFAQCLLAPSDYTPVFSLIAGILAGSFTLVLIVCWADYFSDYDIRQSLLGIGTLLVLSSLLTLCLSALLPETQIFLFAALTVFGAAGAASNSLTRPQARPQARAQTDGMSACLDDLEKPGDRASVTPNDQDAFFQQLAPALKSNLLPTLRDMFSVIHGPYIGFVIFAMTMAGGKVFFGALAAENLGTVIGIIAVLPLCFVRFEKPLLPFIYQVLLPIVVGVLILLNSLPSQGPLPVLTSLGLYIFFSVIGLFALASFTAAANAKEFSVPLIFGFTIASFAAFSLLGLHLADPPLLASHFNTLLNALTVLYFLYLLVWPCVKSWGQMYRAASPTIQHNVHEVLEIRCETLAQNYGLSQRESVIMSFIGRGYSPAFIAKKLFLSDSTVRTHVKSIYRKLNVHSRQELLVLVDEGEAAFASEPREPDRRIGR